MRSAPQVRMDAAFTKKWISAGCRGIAAGGLLLLGGAALAATESDGNNLFGYNTGLTGGAIFNSQFGGYAGAANGGSYNAFFGWSAGRFNNIGGNNAFFGVSAGYGNHNGNYNSFFGSAAGGNNYDGSNNSFFGSSAGNLNTAGGYNAFFGESAGFSNAGNFNAFFGQEAGRGNTTGNDNAFFGRRAGYGSADGSGNTFIGTIAGFSNTAGVANTFLGMYAGYYNTTGSFNTFLGRDSGLSNTNEADNTFVGGNANGVIGLYNGTAIGRNALVAQSNSLVLGSIAGVNGATATVNVGLGTASPARQLHVAGDSPAAGINNTTAIRVENYSSSVASRTLLELVNRGPSSIALKDLRIPGKSWLLQNASSDFLISRTGQIPLRLSDAGRLTIKSGTNLPHLELQTNGDLKISGTLTQGSDVHSKKDIVALDGRAVLEKLDALPVSAWTYKSDEDGARHAGPMAQDFHATFGLGDDPTRLAPGDVAGVALAALKQLRAENRELQSELASRTVQLQDALDALNARMVERDVTLAALQERLHRVEETAAAGSLPRTVAQAR